MVAVPDPVRLPGVIDPQPSPDGTASVRVTMPVNPFSGVRVMVDVDDTPTLEAGGADATMTKS